MANPKNKSDLAQWQRSSYLNGANAPFLEDLYERYLNDPDSVSAKWREIFANIERSQSVQSGSGTRAQSQTKSRTLPSRPPLKGAPPRPMPSVHNVAAEEKPAGVPMDLGEKQAAVLRLINAYRVRGHQDAHLDPLDLADRPPVPDLTLDFQGLDKADLDTVFHTGSLFGAHRLPLRKIIEKLEYIYRHHVGSEYMHIVDTAEKRWIQNRLEGEETRPFISTRGKMRLLNQLVAAEGLERFLHSRYVGQKRFSLEGGESLIPILKVLITRSSAAKMEEMVIGMAHRGRLNVLVNILGKSMTELFEEFEGAYDPLRDLGTGDVKYHKGASADVRTNNGDVHVTLAFNPSHLEIVGPVVQGSVRARQHRRIDRSGLRVLPVVIHGDAAFAGQGVVMETFQMSQARGYGTGGTVHIVVNNQIGFTTSDPLDARSSFYCTEVAKLVQAPIFHVNGDDPEAVLFVARLALDYRNAFHKDVVIDLVCYRRHGHNEADEPAATQPMMYQRIKQHPTTPELYAQRLMEEGVFQSEDFDAIKQRYRDKLEEAQEVAPEIQRGKGNQYQTNWRPYLNAQWMEHIDTALPVSELQELGDQLLSWPQEFVLHPRVAKIMDNRKRMNAGAYPVDWGYAETLAYATLVKDGFQVRLSGQDSERGTFFHRHAVLHCTHTGREYTPLQNVTEKQNDFVVINSLLSEAAVLAFEYGYATAEPLSLVIWEAQFGDFANGAQVVIDQFISSGEAKWGRLCGLTLFLPHGLEGQGAEHSSARIERFLQLCAEHNMQVVMPTTPAQMYHLIRRQTIGPVRRPLIVMTPKSLLRNKLSTSSLDELASGQFHPLIPDQNDHIDKDQVHRLVLCSGKVYYDLATQREKLEMCHTAIIRIERLYPFPLDELNSQLALYPALRELVWCQEEPQNQGPWYQIVHHLRSLTGDRRTLRYAGRNVSPAPAVGYHSLHAEQQRALVDNALGPDQ